MIWLLMHQKSFKTITAVFIPKLFYFMYLFGENWNSLPFMCIQQLPISKTIKETLQRNYFQDSDNDVLKCIGKCIKN